MHQEIAQPIKYFLYARKSSEGEDRQVSSIESQIDELTKLAERNNIVITEVFSEAKSAKAPGREVFRKMIDRIKKGEANGILCWKLNRLARNPIDGGEISWLLQQGIVQRILASDRSYYPTDNVLMMAVELGMANQFIRDLSTDAKRGLRTKAKNGWFPGKAPLGYLHHPLKNKGEKEVINDPERFEIVRKAIKGIASGKYTVPQAFKVATKEWKLTNRDGGRLSISTWYATLNNPFYYGEFEFPRGSGNWYKGKHQAMITQTEFLRIQAHLKKKGTTRPQKYTFSYTGLIQCGNCGAMITAEHKTKRNLNGNVHFYTYYHCTKRKDPNCPEKTVEEKVLEEQIMENILAIDIPSSFKDWAIRYLKETESKELESEDKITESQQKAFDGIEQKINRLLDMRINNEISEAEFITKKEEFAAEKLKLKELLEKPQQEHWIKKLERAMDTAADIAKAFEEGNESKRKQILYNLGSNLYIKSKKFEIEASNPILLMKRFSSPVKRISARFEPLKNASDKEKLELSYSSSSLVLAWRDSFRTFEWERAVPSPEAVLVQTKQLCHVLAI